MRLVICAVLLLGVCSALEVDLGIGDSPTSPTDSSEITLVQGPNLTDRLSRPNTDKNGSHTPTRHTDLLLLAGNGGGGRENVSDFLAIMSPEGGVLTLWALNVGNWVWGYSLIDSREFGAARIWRIFTKSDGSSSIQNAKEGTCLGAYRNGVVHTYCNMEDPTQLWTFHLFDNQAVQIKNVATKQCLQTPTNQATQFFSIFLTGCVQGGKLNSDQQWFITAPPFKASMIFSIR